MRKVDLKAARPQLYKPRKGAVTEVDVPPQRCLMVRGQGDPQGAAYQEAVQALFTAAYAIKRRLKEPPYETDYTVLPLESLWDSPGEGLDMSRRDRWRWTALIVQPEDVDEGLASAARADAARKKELPALEQMTLETLHEGRSAQVLHIGPFHEEGPAIERLHGFIAEQGGTPRGAHHEVYLSDPARTAPERLRTIIRQPFA